MSQRYLFDTCLLYMFSYYYITRERFMRLQSSRCLSIKAEFFFFIVHESKNEFFFFSSALQRTKESDFPSRALQRLSLTLSNESPLLCFSFAMHTTPPIISSSLRRCLWCGQDGLWFLRNVQRGDKEFSAVAL